jgi:hypothetical protein
MHTFYPQYVPIAQTLPKGHSALLPQVERPAQGVLPSTQKPVLSVMGAQTHEPPGPQGPKSAQVWPPQELKEQAPLVQPS